MTRSRLGNPAPSPAVWLRGLTGLGLSAALLWMLIATTEASLQGFVAALAQVPLWGHAAVALAQAALVILAALKWTALLRASDASGLGWPDATVATTWATLAGQVLPIQLALPVVRTWYVRRRRLPATVAIGTSLLEQSFDLLVLAIMLIAGLAIQLVPGPAALPIIAGMLVLPLFVLRPALSGLGSAVGMMARGINAARGPQALTALLDRAASGLAKAALLPPYLFRLLIALSLLRYLLILCLYIGLMLSFVPGADLRILVGGYPLALLAASLPILPAGLGILELTWTGLLVLAGSAPDAAVEAAVALRLVSVFGFLLAAPVLILLPRMIKRGAA